MAKKRTPSSDGIGDYRHDSSTRLNIPPARLASEGTVPAMPKSQYAYHPRRPPELRFDTTGKTDRLAELLAAAKERPLTEDEVAVLAAAVRTHEPWLEWAGKREMPGFAVDPVALQIHERISAQAIIKIAARQDIERDLFADPQHDYHQAVQFYRHDIDWANRLILGDSLQVMASLSKREALAGKVQMIYLDPPYGIKFGSNFQPEVGKRDVKDTPQDLTREAEMVKAYRDTWHLGIHSYLAYLRDRLILARELLADTGSIFVQISDENVHRVRNLMDEVFGAENFVSEIIFIKTASATSETISSTYDIIIWFSKLKSQLKQRPLYSSKSIEDDAAEAYKRVMGSNGEISVLDKSDAVNPDRSRELRIHRLAPITSQRPAQSGDVKEFDFCGRAFNPGKGTFKTDVGGLSRLAKANRIEGTTTALNYVRFLADFPVVGLSNCWTDTSSGSGMGKVYVVQTSQKVIQRCMLMTTDPGDLVLDPTCGSATTAYVAEQWGRRWITIDTSRVAVAIARQRLLTAKFDYYRLSDDDAGVVGNFVYKSVPHITLGSIARNASLDPIFARHEPVLEAKLKAANAALLAMPPDLRTRMSGKLSLKETREGKRAVSDADRRRWNLPGDGYRWEHWTVPFDTDADWPTDLQTAVTAYRTAWRAKMDEVNACIAANADQEELVDQPQVVKGLLRVSGPFTVEGVQPPEISLGEALGEFGGAPDDLPDTFPSPTMVAREATLTNGFEVENVGAYLEQMTKLLRLDGVRFPDNRTMLFSRLDRLDDSSRLHAEGRWHVKGEADDDAQGEANVGVVFGPQYGPFTEAMLEAVIKPARRMYDALVIAGFSFTAEVQDLADNHQVPKFRIHVAHIRPDVNPGMAGLLKEQPGSQLFSVFGQPRTNLIGPDERMQYKVSMEGVDIYDPVSNTIRDTKSAKVAAWFIDGDYDGRTFCVTQAFFPDRSAWEKLAKALSHVVDADRFETLSGTLSLPFPAGRHKCVAVRVIDPRGNEVMQVHRLG